MGLKPIAIFVFVINYLRFLIEIIFPNNRHKTVR